jgi:hypothetical protein
MSAGILTQILEALGGTYNGMGGIETQILEAITAPGGLFTPYAAPTDLNATTPTEAQEGRVVMVLDAGDISWFQLQAGDDADDGATIFHPDNFETGVFEYIWVKQTPA